MNTIICMIKEGILHPLSILFYPSDTFTYIKDKRTDLNYLPAIIIMVLLVPVRVLGIYLINFSYSTILPRDANIWLEIIRMLVPLITWVVASYAITTILDGESFFLGIFTASVYCFIPYVLLNIPITALTRLMSLEESGFLRLISIGLWVWIFLLFLLSVKVLNDYTVGKTIGVTLLSLVFVVLIWAVFLLFLVLSNQIYSFVLDVLNEFKMLYLE